MPGRTPHAAYKQFITPIERAIACVAKTKLVVSPKGHHVGPTYQVLLPGGDPITLDGVPRLMLDVSLIYSIIEDQAVEGGPYRVTTVAYQHSISSDSGSEIVGYHWHPSGNSHETRPHVHVGSQELRHGAVLGNKAHVMTGRCSIEQVVRTAIQLGARPRCSDWSKRLDQGHDVFVKYRTWH